MYTILYTCDIVQETKPTMAEWAAGKLFSWLPGQPFVFHRSVRSVGIDAPELVAYVDFDDETSAQTF